MQKKHRVLGLLLSAVLVLGLNACVSSAKPESKPETPASNQKSSSMKDLSAWEAQKEMSPGINIGNTLENTTKWETGWGQPLITKNYIQALADYGYKTVRLPVAWDTYAVDGVIQKDKFERVNEVVDWIIEAGMYCVVNIHWDGGWIDSSWQEHFPETYATFSKEAEKKFVSYWTQIAQYFSGKSEKLIFEGLNEETNFTNEGSEIAAYITLTRVNQLFIDTVRKTGGNNAKRLLVVTGYKTDFMKTADPNYEMPSDTVANKLFISVHYYTPWQFCGMDKDESWGKMKATWGAGSDYSELEYLFDKMAQFSQENDCPVFLGEYNVVAKKESASRVRWLTAVTKAALDRNMIPVLWDTGSDFLRTAPFSPSDDLNQAMINSGLRLKN